MTVRQQILTIALAALATQITRFLPFLAFRKSMPRFVQYLGRVLPSAVFSLLVVYCLKEVDPLSGSRGLPEALGILTVALLHRWKGQMLLSIAGGTLCYMLLVQGVF